MTVGALVLAAGAGRRMGEGPPKPLRPWRGVPLVAHVAAAVVAAGLPGLVVVSPGPTGAQVARAARPLRAVVAEEARFGLSRSLGAGLAAAPDDWTGALVLLADMPMVAPATLALLAARLADPSGAWEAVVPVHRGQRGNPVGLARAFWARAGVQSGDQGARALLGGLGSGLGEVPVDDPGVLVDFDHPRDLLE